MSKIQTEIVFSEEAQFADVVSGAEKLYNAVKTTMGPSGHTVIIEHGYDKFPTITKDGVTVAKSINLKPKLQSIGARLIKEVAVKTNDVAGDGTTTATVFAYNLLKEGYKKAVMGSDPIEIKKGMDAALIDALNVLDSLKNKIDTYEESKSVATISANGDDDLGSLIADAVTKVGVNGVVTVESSKSMNTSLHMASGVIVDSGYLNPFFITDSSKGTCVLDNAKVLITDQKIFSVGDIKKIAEEASMTKKPLLIICDDLEGDALNTFITNKMRGALSVCVIKAPSYGEHRLELLADLAHVFGTEVYGGLGGTPLSKIGIKALGDIKKVTVSKGTTIITTTESEEEKVRFASKTEELEKLLASGELESSMINRVRTRLSKITGNIAVIRVGGSTEAEVGERKDRIDDALNATVAANRDGVVVGGGFALLRCAFALEGMKKKYKETHTDSFMAGYQAFILACESPFKTIVGNTGLNPELYYHNAKQYFTAEADVDKTFGFNARANTWGNLFQEGILDPVLVTRSAISYSCSVIGLAISCKAIIIDGSVDEKEEG